MSRRVSLRCPEEDARLVFLQDARRGKIVIEFAGLRLGSPNANQVAGNAVPLGEPVQRLASLIDKGARICAIHLPLKIRRSIENRWSFPRGGAWLPQFRRGSLINIRIMPRILIVDDDPVTSLLLSDLLVEIGYEVLGPVYSVSAALALLENCQPDAAIIDVSLGTEDSYPVADRLVRASVPFIFATGFGVEAISERFEDASVLAKPFGFEAVQTAVAGLLRPSY